MGQPGQDRMRFLGGFEYPNSASKPRWVWASGHPTWLWSSSEGTDQEPTSIRHLQRMRGKECHAGHQGHFSSSRSGRMQRRTFMATPVVATKQQALLGAVDGVMDDTSRLDLQPERDHCRLREDTAGSRWASANWQICFSGPQWSGGGKKEELNYG